MRFWNLDLHRDLGTHRLSWRRLSVLIANLPKESATVREMLGAQFVEWSTTDWLLAGVIDVLQGANWQRGGGKGSRPKPVERPKSLPEIERKQREHAEAQDRVTRLRERRKEVNDGSR